MGYALILFLYVLQAALLWLLPKIPWIKNCKPVRYIQRGYSKESLSFVGFCLSLGFPLLSIVTIDVSKLSASLTPSASYPEWTFFFAILGALSCSNVMLYISGKNFVAMEDHESTLEMYVKFTKNRVTEDFTGFVDEFRNAIGGLNGQMFWRVTFYYADSSKRDRFFAIARQSNKENYKTLRRYEYRAPIESCLYKCWNLASNSICEQKFDSKKYSTVEDWIKSIGYDPQTLNMKSDHLIGWRLKSLKNGRSAERDGVYQGVVIFEIEGKDLANFRQIIETCVGSEKAKALRKALWNLSGEE